MLENLPVIVVVGATGTGKSALAVNLALELQKHGRAAEIINADAMQLYRGMDIGTAKLTDAQMQNIPHHLFSVLDPAEDATVSAFQNQVRELVNTMRNNNKTPIIVGGSGLYVNSAIYEMDLAPHDDAIRKELEQIHEIEGLEKLVDMLQQEDPETAKQIDLHNSRRVIRALEVFRITGQSLIANLPDKPKPVWPLFLVGVQEEREVLTKRLDDRVLKMWQDGLLKEAQVLKNQGELGKTASQAIGYAQAFAQLDGTMTEQEATQQTQFLTRRYARRQVSWFKRLPDVRWISSTQSQSPLTVANLIRDYHSIAC